MIQREDGYFNNFARIDKAYRKLCYQAVEEYGFTPNEVVVLMFLSNNPELDSASDIAHYRNISKGLVAKSVEALCERGYLKTGKDKKDRRLIHLYLTEESQPVVEILRQCRRDFVEKLREGVPPKDLEVMERTSARMSENLNTIMKGMK